MRGIICCLAALVLLALPAGAGPWARDPGRAFLAFSVEQDRDDNRHSGLYSEYGLNAGNTLGFELGRTRDETTLLVWWQCVLGRPSPNRWTVSLGLGAIQRDGRYHPMGQFATAWGAASTASRCCAASPAAAGSRSRPARASPPSPANTPRSPM